MESKKKKLFLYPLLVGLYPVLSLLANNITEIKLSDGYRAIAISILLSMLVYLIAGPIVRKSDKVAFSICFVHLSLFLLWSSAYYI